jgi:YkoY family integral membrane protein
VENIGTQIVAILTIATLESFLSLDNAVVLALIARELKPDQQKKALRYGLLGAVVLRLAAVGVASVLIKYAWVKILGGLYLGYLAVKYFLNREKQHLKKTKAYPSFWKTVAMIEVTDLAFAIDSILAAVALTNHYWVIVAGGLIGVLVIRFAAQGMIKLLDRHPKLEAIAYVLILGVSIKVLYQGVHSFW